jgi:ankyrin repeat protein
MSLIAKILSILWAAIVLLVFSIGGIYIFMLIIRSLKEKLKETLKKSLRKSCQNGDSEDVRRRLAGGENVNTKEGDETTPLHYASTNKINELFIKNGAHLNAESKCGIPLHSAIYWGCKEIAKLLIDNGADVNAKYDDGDSPYGQGDHVLLLVYPV